MEETFKENPREKIIVLSDLEILNKDSLTDYFFIKSYNNHYYVPDDDNEIKQKAEEDKKAIIEKKNKLIKQSLELYKKKDNQKIKELVSAFNQITLKVIFNGEPKILREGIFYTLSDNCFKMYDSKYFKKLLEIKSHSLIISAILLDNNDLIFACSDFGIFQILVYRLKDKQYFEIQKIIENGLGFQARYGNHGFCGNTAYKIKYKIDDLKAISRNRFICISNYGLKIYSLNENNEYSLVLLQEHLNDVKIIHEINNNKFILCTKKNLDDTYRKNDKIIIEIVELKEITKQELKDKLFELNNYGYHLKSRRFGYYMFDNDINEKDENIYKDKLPKYIELLKLSCSFNEIIKLEKRYIDFHLSNYIIIKKKYFMVLIDNSIFIIDLFNGNLIKKYEILINLIFNGNDSLFIYKFINIQKWNNPEDNEFIIFIEKNIILFELNEDENSVVNLKILNYSYFPNIDNGTFEKMSEKTNKFYSQEHPRPYFYNESKNNENSISIY